MSVDSEEFGREVVDALTKEIVENRNQMIKNANSIGNLVSEVREIHRQLQQQRQGLSVNSIGAYVLFVVLIAGGLYLLHRSRLERLEHDTDSLHRQHAVVRAQLEDLRKKARERGEAEAQAMRFYQLMKARQIHRAIAAYPKLVKLPLSKVEAAVFESWVERKRGSLAYSSYSAGMRAVGEKSWKRAAIAFGKALELEKNPPYAAPLYFYQGIALMKLGSNREAVAAFESALGARAEKLVSNQLRYHLGALHEALGERTKARAAYRAYLKRYPSGSHARLARRRLKALAPGK